MITIIFNGVREKIRSKQIYIVMIIGMLFMLLISTGDSLSINGEKIVNFSQRVPVAIAINMFIGSLLAIMVSLQTIPKEYERKTAHLIVSRGVKPHIFMFSLTLANIVTSLLVVFALNISLFIFAYVLSASHLILDIFSSILLVSVNVVVISAMVSFFSVIMPSFLNTIISVFVYFVGVFYSLVHMFVISIDGKNGIGSMILHIFPNFSLVQKQASKALLNQNIEYYPIVLVLLFGYIYVSLAMLFAKKEV